MKHSLLFLLLLCTCALAAQNSSRSVSESTEEDGYTFTVKLDRGQKDLLLQAYETMAGKTLKVKVTGLITEEHDNGVAFSLDTRRNKLKVVHKGNNADGRKEALALVTKVRELLKLKNPPPPPSRY